MILVTTLSFVVEHLLDIIYYGKKDTKRSSADQSIGIWGSTADNEQADQL